MPRAITRGGSVSTNRLTPEEQTAVECAIGRILRMGARPAQPGDIAEYNRCRQIVLDLCSPQPDDYRPDWARDRRRGAQGDQ